MLTRHEQAARNNAIWCDAVCRAHGCPCEFVADAWLNRGTPPPYYSNMVTMRGGGSAIAQQKLIRQILESEPDRSFGFKDSFSCIDTTGLGGARKFEKLFEATWIWLDSENIQPRKSSLRWERIGTDPDLLNWEHTWRGDAANQSAGSFRQFPPSLLDNPEVAFLAGKDAGNRILAVAVANHTGEVIGLSNVFGPACSGEELWAGATHAAVNAFSKPLPLVGYERGESLRQALDQGFEPIGPLRVYVLNNVQ